MDFIYRRKALCMYLSLEIKVIRMFISSSPTARKTVKLLPASTKKLGKYNDLLAQFSGDETAMMDWAKKEVEKETLLYNQRREKVTVSFSPLARIPLDEERLFNVGYLFLQQLCTDLRLDNICRNIRNHHRFTNDFHAILTDLIYARILSPSSKLSSFSYCQSLLENRQSIPCRIFTVPFPFLQKNRITFRKSFTRTPTLSIRVTQKFFTTTAPTIILRLKRKMA